MITRKWETQRGDVLSEEPMIKRLGEVEALGWREREKCKEQLPEGGLVFVGRDSWRISSEYIQFHSTFCVNSGEKGKEKLIGISLSWVHVANRRYLSISKVLWVIRVFTNDKDDIMFLSSLGTIRAIRKWSTDKLFIFGFATTWSLFDRSQAAWVIGWSHLGFGANPLQTY